MKVIASVTSDPKLTFERVRGSDINPSQSSFLARASYVESDEARILSLKGIKEK